MPPILAKLKIHGTVQGVGFRAFAILCANSLGIGGTVRNCQDGTVEIECECETGKQLEEFRGMLMRKEKFGISVSKIETLEQTESEQGWQKFAGFGAVE